VTHEIMQPLSLGILGNGVYKSSDHERLTIFYIPAFTPAGICSEPSLIPRLLGHMGERRS